MAAADVVVGTVEVPVAYLALGDFDQALAHGLLGSGGLDALLERQHRLLLEPLMQEDASLEVVDLRGLVIDGHQLV